MSKSEYRKQAEALYEKLTMEERMGQLQCYWPLSVDQIEGLENYPEGVGSLACPKVLYEDKHFLDDFIKKTMEKSPHKIPALVHMEGLCGAFLRGAASFPSGIARGSSWDPELEYEIGKLTAKQERAVGVSQTFSPVLDITRDPRMGRYAESYGEDPTLAAAMGVAHVKGMQENQETAMQTHCVAKHFLAFHNVVGGVQSTECQIPQRELREIYAKPFQAAITEANLTGIMPCYDVVDGQGASGSKAILTTLLRDEMGFDGICSSDYSGIFNLHQFQKVAETLTHAGKMALEAGMDVELPNKQCFNDELLEWIKEGKVDIEAFKRAVIGVLEVKIRTGLMEDMYSQSDELIEEAFNCKENKELPLRAAREALVLLKNDGALPLRKDGKGICEAEESADKLEESEKRQKIAVIGCHGNDPRFYFGGYTFYSFIERRLAMRSGSMAGDTAGFREDVKVKTIPGTPIEAERPEFKEALYDLKPGITSIYEELSARMIEADVCYAYGYPFAGNDQSGFEEALKLAEEADIVIVTLGQKYSMGTISAMGEGIDATHIGLPECQEMFLQKLEKLNKTVIGIHIDGRPITSDTADRVCNALIEAWSPAEAGSPAIVDALLGEYNPSGKLTVSVPRCEGQIPIYYNHKNGSWWHQSYSIGFPDYVDCSHKPRYHFGHGLSYTTFEYDEMTMNKTEFEGSDEMQITCTVKNTGDYDGTEIVQLYVSDEYASMVRPVQELAGFKRVFLKAGEKKTIQFTLPMSQLAFLDEEMRWKVEKGSFLVQIGAASDDIRLENKFCLVEDMFVDGKTRGFYANAEVM